MPQAMMQDQGERGAALPPRQGKVLAGKEGMARVESGHWLVDADDAVLDVPVVYYNPQEPQLKFRLVPGQYPLPHFVNGRYIAQTVRQEEVVRRILGSNADRWKGDSPQVEEEMLCPHPGCNFASRNWHAIQDHFKYSGHMGG